MNLVSWKDDYSVGVQEIDNQHKKLLDIINELYTAIKTGKSREVMGKVLNDLLDYTAYHFSVEEKYFDEYGYPFMDTHRNLHDELIAKVKLIHKRFENGENVISIDVMNFLKDWLQDHMITTDKKFGIFLNSKGID